MMFTIESEKSLVSKCATRYKGMAYDGCWFYFTKAGQCKIVQLDQCFQQVKCIETGRSYNNICYDSKEDCFWASADNSSSMIYKLNTCFEEIDCRLIRTPYVGGMVTGISYNCCNDGILVSFANGIICLNKYQPKDSVILKRSQRNERIMGVLSICPYYICYSFSEQKKTLSVYGQNGSLLHEAIVPNELMLEAAVFFPCVKEGCRCHFYVLLSKHNAYPYVIDYTMTDEALCQGISPCNDALCHRICPEIDPCCHEPTCCDDVLTSIAVEGAAIAHILNAEGEKLQKAIASTNDICTMLEVNEAIRRMVIEVTHLEHALYEKLEGLNKCCDFCDYGGKKCHSTTCDGTKCHCDNPCDNRG